MQKILLIGHTGFIGKNLVRFLSKQKFFDMTLINRELTLPNGIFEGRNYGGWVINLAAQVGAQKGWDYPGDMISTNARLTTEACLMAKKTGSMLLHMSSYVYGKQRQMPIDESSIPDVTNPYMASKIISEEVVKNICTLYRIKYVILRPFNLFGPGQTPSFLIPSIIESAKTGRAVDIFDLEARRDYLHVDDLCRAIVTILKSEKVTQGVFNVASSNSYSVQELIEIIEKYMGKITINNLQGKDVVKECYGDISKIYRAYGWAPSITVEKGIKKLVS